MMTTQTKRTERQTKANTAISAELILIKNGLVRMPEPMGRKLLDVSMLGTIISNLSYYGFVPSKEAATILTKLTEEQVKEWWGCTEPYLKEITGENRKMDRFVVYKNFPQEVLEMSQVQYWVSQILMYIGLPNEYFTQTEVARDKMFEKVSLKVLQPAKTNSLDTIYTSLLKNVARWTPEQFDFVKWFVIKNGYKLETKLIPFKENLVSILAPVIENNLSVQMSSATDVLRLGVALSDGDVTFKTNSKFKTFPRKQRRFLLEQLESCKNLAEDVGRDENRWKKFLKALHPGDYRFCTTVSQVYNSLYRNDITTFNSKVESLLAAGDVEVLPLLQTRPGEYIRRLHKLISVFGGKKISKSLTQILPELKVIQLLKLGKYIETINKREFLTFAPKGNWTKLQVQPNNKRKIENTVVNDMLTSINYVLRQKLAKSFGSGVELSTSVNRVKLQTNDSDLMPYGRGTEFVIPHNIKFIRSASYWRTGGQTVHNVWYDNGWNFFNANWKNTGTCCWNANKYDNGAIFSGDPTSSKDLEGNACQMIDLYIDKLLAMGVRYAVWNILCYNQMSFNKVKEVYAALQWGEEPQKGGLFEPSRCQISFPLKGDNLTKYIAYIDLQERKLVYMDANLWGNVRSAVVNGERLQQYMPAYLEYLEALPSVWDLFKNAKQDRKGIPVIYSDTNMKIQGGKAYVFKPTNKENKYNQLVLTDYLNL